MLITHINHQPLSTPCFIYPVPSMRLPYSSQNKEETTVNRPHRRPHQHEAQKEHNKVTLIAKGELSSKFPHPSRSSFIPTYTQENVFAQLATDVSDPAAEDKTKDTTNIYPSCLNGSSLHNQQEGQNSHQTGPANFALECQYVEFPKCAKVYFTNKWNGTSVLMYKYMDNEGNVFVSGKSRMHPTLKDINQFDCLLSCAKEALKLSKEIHGDEANAKLTLENLPESLLVLLDPLVQSVAFEICGSALPHLVKYDFKIDAKPLFITKINGAIVPYKLYILSQQTSTPSQPSKEIQNSPYDDIGPIPMDQNKIVHICEEFKQLAFDLNEKFRRERNIPLSYYFESFIIEGKVIYFLNEDNELVHRNALFKVKPKDIELFHWEQFDAPLQAKALEALCKIYQRDLPMSDETIRKEMELSERGWARFARDILKFLAAIPNSLKFRRHPLTTDVITFPDYENAVWFQEYKMQQKAIVTVGLPGSGKSTFAKRLEPFGWIRLNQDELGSRKLVELHMEKALREGFDVIVDRCNFDYWQRNVWIRLCQNFNITQIWCLFFDIPAQICKERVSARTNHPSIPSGDSGFAVVDKFVGLMIPPKLIEGFIDIIIVKPETDINAVVKFFSLIVHKPETRHRTPPRDSSPAAFKNIEIDSCQQSQQIIATTTIPTVATNITAPTTTSATTTIPTTSDYINEQLKYVSRQ